MTTNFTFRDFIVYLLTGSTFILCIGLIFHNDIFSLTTVFFTKYDFISDFSFLVTIFLIPFIYLLGHTIGTIETLILKYFVWLHKQLKDKKNWFLKYFLKMNNLLFYRHRIVYAIVRHWKSEKTDKAFTSTEGFWTLCATLQKSNHYSSVVYWYVLNDLFKQVSLIFFMSTITSFFHNDKTLALIFIALTILFFIRAIQYADYFVSSVCRLSKK